jgi:ABC-2 type transport system permease protein
MIPTIARKELTELWRDGRVRWLTGIVALTLLTALFAGWQSYRQANAERERAQRDERQRWLDKGEMSGHSAAHYGQYVFKRDAPLFAVDPGVSPYTGSVVFLEAHSHNPLTYRPAADTPAPRRYAELTASSVLQIFVPLLIVLLCYPLFVGEREQGTLRQLMSSGVSPHALAAGKLLGVVGPLFLVLALLAVVGSLALLLNAGPDAAIDLPKRLAFLTAGYLMYFVVIAGASLIVSARAASSRQALVVLLGCWFANSLLLPQMASDLAARIDPAIDGFELPAAVANGKARLPTPAERLPEIERRLLAEYRVTRVADLPVDPKRVANIESDADGDRIQDQIFNEMHDAYGRQDRLYQLGALLAPMIGVQSLSMTLAGTHFAHYRRFSDAAEAYRQQLVHLMDQADLHSDAARANSTAPIIQSRETWERLPPFEYAPPTLAWSLSQSRTGLLLLLLWCAGILVVTPVAVLKLKVD